MNILFPFSIISLSMFFTACSESKKIASFPIVNIALANSEEGTILIRTTGEAESEAKAVLHAEKTAFNTLFFVGYPSSPQVRPLIENPDEVKRTNSSFFTIFFETGDYKKYIVNAFNYSATQKVGKYYYLNRDIKINLRSLRTYLESKEITRKFGY